MNQLDANSIRRNHHLIQKMKVLYHKMTGVNVEDIADAQHDIYKHLRRLENLYADYIQKYRNQNKKGKKSRDL